MEFPSHLEDLQIGRVRGASGHEPVALAPEGEHEGSEDEQGPGQPRTAPSHVLHEDGDHPHQGREHGQQQLQTGRGPGVEGLELRVDQVQQLGGAHREAHGGEAREDEPVKDAERERGGLPRGGGRLHGNGRFSTK